MNGENPLPVWARHALIGIGLFLAGGAISFGYSYRPLHGELSWQVDQLESRLDERNRENVQLSDAIAKHKTSDAKRVDPETLSQVERELQKTKRVLTQAEKDLKLAKRKRKESSAQATKWRKRYEELRDTSRVAAAPAPAPSQPDLTQARPTESNPAALGSSPEVSAEPGSGQSPRRDGRGMLPSNGVAAP
jgi:hypothetical protein